MDLSLFASLNSQDADGNTLSVDDHGTVSLRLKRENMRLRIIGGVGVTDKGTPFYDKVVKEGNRFRKTDSWGLNWAILETLPSEAVIRLRSENGTYKIKAADARIAGSFLWFKDQGFERQFFVPVSAFSVT